MEGETHEVCAIHLGRRRHKWVEQGEALNPVEVLCCCPAALVVFVGQGAVLADLPSDDSSQSGFSISRGAERVPLRRFYQPERDGPSPAEGLWAHRPLRPTGG